ncbi:MAG0130/MAG3770 family membrane protein [Mycoplasmopsis bovis]|uniref:Putative membrane protein n=1 Tax=Mycoplasmopsis bovis (strain ATCC 25523 / DSM 22781 / NCTC 10131 / PG45) TaxID=289397 RepID=A0A454AQ72_MYCBG|nr:hypothetical protein [Mycoplasmopsis bovis]ADR25206.1 putative membrane protein [Mycoplasmopsis bovis PG45]MBT1315972.1 hypothetical protein [Mycoplasmopsis bovis]MBT1317314.1 hypothetical protein [Mycoplasmopsis bovis]MBT1321098.1 hypothetical protein [Mycoplasmopsis bovis]MBT1322605.1 hypothetical protein [Mycoplasmopsis bovis]
MNDINIDKLERFASYSRNKKFLYTVYFIGLLAFLYIVSVIIALLVYRKWNNVSLGLAISLMVLGVIWILFLGPVLQLFNLSFIAFRALENDPNPWRSKKPYLWILNFQTFFALYAYNLINNRKHWFTKDEKQKLVTWLFNQNDNISLMNK